MRILVVCQHFYPENFRINDLCYELVRKGYDVTVLTGLPNYPEGRVLKEYRGFRNRSQLIKGVKIKRCTLIGRGTSIFRMGMNYLCFALLGSIKALGIREEFDLIYVYQLSPVTMAWPAIVVKKAKKIPLIVHCLDQWPISVTTGPISKKSILYKMLYNISVWTYKKADLITISSKSFKNYFENELKISARKKGLIYFPSYAESDYANIKKVDNNVFDILFAGNIGPAQSCETIVECANLLKEYNDIKFHIVGDGLNKSNCESMAKKYNLKNIEFYGYHAVTEMPRFYSLADCFVITMVDNEVVNSTLPAKIQSYMLAGKPVFGAISGEVKQVISEAQCGVCTESGNAKELAEIIKNNYRKEELLEEWGRNGLSYYNSNFEKEKSICNLENIFKKIVKKGGKDV